MIRVKIAKFKSHLSGYLTRVRRGEQIVVTDRETPIAKIVPYTSFAGQITILAAANTPRVLHKIKVPPTPAPTNSLRMLQEEREDDLEP